MFNKPTTLIPLLFLAYGVLALLCQSIMGRKPKK